MPLHHLLSTVGICVLWGLNFVAVKWGMAEFPAFFMTAGRYALCVVPWVLFVPRPRVSWRMLMLFGGVLGAGQFGLMYYAMRSDISPGLTSLLMQSQVFFTVGLSMGLQGERLKGPQVLALVLALAGIAVIGWHSVQSGNGSVTPLGLFMVLGAAMCWAVGNMVVRRAGKIDALGFLVWSSIFALPPLFGLSLVFEGWPAIVHSVVNATHVGWMSLVWQSVINTLLGFGVWNWLLARYPAATVAPFSLLVPVSGMTASALVLGESMPSWKLIAAALVLAGLALNVYASRARQPAL